MTSPENPSRPEASPLEQALEAYENTVSTYKEREAYSNELFTKLYELDPDLCALAREDMDAFSNPVEDLNRVGDRVSELTGKTLKDYYETEQPERNTSLLARLAQAEEDARAKARLVFDRFRDQFTLDDLVVEKENAEAIKLDDRDEAIHELTEKGKALLAELIKEGEVI